ncbi:MAG TPA: hypothetical protein VHY19_10125 [Steroidobacteraceae bacterium]|jgi:hypothetical protein|nr:hypothetical protein [Steroidobacteraceae bacterium]
MKRVQFSLGINGLTHRTALLSLGSLAVGSMLFAAPAKAGCVDPRGGGTPAVIHHLPGLPGLFGSSIEHQTIVGTWHVVYTEGGGPFGEAFIQWHSDGTEWENISLPVLDGNLCLGSWKQIRAATFARNHYGWLYDAGLLSGYFNETETDVLSKDGNSYSGTNDIKMYDMSGNLTMDITGTASAERIQP